MSGFLKRSTTNTVNPAGGVNPAQAPNAGQYGWTKFESNAVNQIIQYVNACEQYAKIAKECADYVATNFEEVKTFVEYMKKLYDALEPMISEFTINYKDVVKKHGEIVTMHGEVVSLHGQVVTLHGETVTSEFRASVSAQSAKSSEDASLVYLTESRGIAEELRRSKVYRGVWNIEEENKYPDEPDTNSEWDVVLKTGNLTGFDFGGFHWNWGDRIIYLKATDTDPAEWQQVGSGQLVTSVNGETGAVVITPDSIKAANSGFGLGEEQAFTVTDMNANPLTWNGGKMGWVRGISTTANKPDNQPGIAIIQRYQSGPTSIVNLVYVAHNGKTYTRRWSGTAWDSWATLYSTSNKPSTTDLGALNILDAEPGDQKVIRIGGATLTAIQADIDSKYSPTNQPDVIALGALPLAGGRMTGPIEVAGIKSAIKVNDQRSISYQDAGGVMYHNLSINNQLIWAHGNNADSTIMYLDQTGTLHTNGAQYSRNGHVSRSNDNTRWLSIETQNEMDPYIAYRSENMSALEKGIIFGRNEITSQRTFGANHFRVGGDGGLRFSAYQDLQGVSWGVGINDATGDLSFHKYNSGVWDSAPVTIAHSGAVYTTVPIFNQGGFYKSIRATNPIGMEMEIPGAHATMMWMDSNASINFSSSNGGGSEATRLASINGAGLFSYKRVHASPVSVSWGADGTFCGNFPQDFANINAGEWFPLISSCYTAQIGVGYSHKWSMGHYRTGGDNNGDVVINIVGDGLLANNLRYHFSSYGGLRVEGTLNGSWWEVSNGGYLYGSIFGAQSHMVNWCMASFAPISDVRHKNVLGDSTENATDVVKQLEFKRFEWNQGEREGEVVEIGLIAQEVESIDPNYTKNVATYNPDGSIDTEVKSLDTAALLSLALKSIQELEARIAILEGRT